MATFAVTRTAAPTGKTDHPVINLLAPSLISIAVSSMWIFLSGFVKGPTVIGLLDFDLFISDRDPNNFSVRIEERVL